MIERLKAALAALEGGDLLCELKAAGLLQAVIAELEAQQPVAVVEFVGEGRANEGMLLKDLPVGTKLYTHPQPKAEPSATEKELRRMLCVAYAGSSAYMDDGEAQDSRDLPCIDFLRDSPTEIRDKMQRRALKALAAQPKAEPCPNGDTCKHGAWCSEVYCQEHCQFRNQQPKAEPAAAPQAKPPYNNFGE